MWDVGSPAALYVGGGGSSPSVTLDPNTKNAAIVLSNGNMTATLTNGAVQDVVGIATVAITSGQKVRIEFNVGAVSTRVAFGIGQADLATADTAFLGCSSQGHAIGNYSDGAGVWQDGSNQAASAGFTTSDVIDVDVDTTTKTASWYLNGTLQVSVVYDLIGNVFAAYGLRYNSVTPASISLVAPASFVHAPLTGYTAYGA